jgi:hypothetical protein
VLGKGAAFDPEDIGCKGGGGKSAAGQSGAGRPQPHAGDRHQGLRARIFTKLYAVDIILQKRENCVSLIRMPDRTFSMTISMISGRPSRFRLPSSIGAVELRIEADRALFDPLPGEGPPHEKNGPGVARNPLKRLVSDERFQGIPKKSNRLKPGNSRSADARLRRPEEIQMSRPERESAAT